MIRSSTDKRASPGRLQENVDSAVLRDGYSGVVLDEGWFGSINSGIVGGIITMAVAAIWFFLGLAADRIFFYPPILFVIGFVAMVKGFFGDQS